MAWIQVVNEYGPIMAFPPYLRSLIAECDRLAISLLIPEHASQLSFLATLAVIPGQVTES